MECDMTINRSGLGNINVESGLGNINVESGLGNINVESGLGNSNVESVTEFELRIRRSY
jgi:hypothetical protein